MRHIKFSVAETWHPTVYPADDGNGGVAGYASGINIYGDKQKVKFF
jgi:hypothetical protein